MERERGEIRALASRGLQAKKLASESHSLMEACEEAAKLLAGYADERQEKVLNTIQEIASLGLSQVFDEPIELILKQVVKARRVEMVVNIKTGELETSIMEARGGGLAAVAGFLLRVCVLLFTPEARRLMFLDEVFAHLSEDYIERMAEFLRELCDKKDLQIILVTHQPEFAEAAEKVYRIEKTGLNTSRFVEEK